MGISHRPEQPSGTRMTTVKLVLRKGAPPFAVPNSDPYGPKDPAEHTFNYASSRPTGAGSSRSCFLPLMPSGGPPCSTQPLPCPPGLDSGQHFPTECLPGEAITLHHKHGPQGTRSRQVLSSRASGVVPVGKSPGRGRSLAGIMLARGLGTVDLQLLPPMGPERAQNSLHAPEKSKRLYPTDVLARSRPCML